MVNLSQIFTVDKECLRHRLGRLSPERVENVDRAIRISLDVQ
jgi:mRNA-degrading endonuclease toxin of MazEF toxin-antitoxin module